MIQLNCYPDLCCSADADCCNVSAHQAAVPVICPITGEELGCPKCCPLSQKK